MKIDAEYLKHLLRGSNYDMAATDGEVAAALSIIGMHDLALRLSNASNDARLAQESWDDLPRRPVTEADGPFAEVLGVVAIDLDQEQVAMATLSKANALVSSIRDEARQIADDMTDA